MRKPKSSSNKKARVKADKGDAITIVSLETRAAMTVSEAEFEELMANCADEMDIRVEAAFAMREKKLLRATVH
jgi:hypothetical protein